MMKQKKSDTFEIMLCIDCFKCKKKKNEIYCKLGIWKEIDKGQSILHTPYDFSCNKWEEA